jgi:EAL domain-containing protein (putative c-di-GMP-specific phosphodiesterase class I)
VDIRTLRPMGVEALARWNHPTRGIIGPATFIPLMEESDVILDFTRKVLEMAVAQLREWLDQGLRLETAINISGRCWNGLNVDTLIVDCCGAHGVDPRWLTLEITETVSLVEKPESIATMRRLVDMGVGLSLDDFGTGYSSLMQLRRLPFSEIKIDKSFVMDCNANDESRIIIESVTEMAHNLGQKVVAEGIESGEVLHRLAFLGCDVAQGYFFSRPVPPRQISSWVGSWTQAHVGSGMEPMVSPVIAH